MIIVCSARVRRSPGCFVFCPPGAASDAVHEREGLLYIYIYIYIYIYNVIDTQKYIYIYIYREREMCIYIYIYIFLGGGPAGPRGEPGGRHGRQFWIPFGDHPLKLERYRED